MLIDDEKLCEIIFNSSSMAEVIKTAIEHNPTITSKEIKKQVKKLDIDTSHWKRKRVHKIKSGTSLKELCVENSWYSAKTRLKERLLEEGVLNNECVECGVGDFWNGKPLVLQLDHINGNNRDHRIENLRILCSNCHSQTSTFSGKNKSKIYG